jgi:hypothetical protein
MFWGPEAMMISLHTIPFCHSDARVGGPNTQAAWLPPHLCNQKTSQRRTDSFSLCDLTNNNRYPTLVTPVTALA